MIKDRLLRLSQIIPRIIPVSKSNWWAGVKAGIFPEPVKLGPRTTAWRESDIMRLVENGVDEIQATEGMDNGNF